MIHTPIAVPDETEPLIPLEESEGWINRRASRLAHRAAQARKGSGRRRLVDPATCDRDYSRAEMEFMLAIQEYKKTTGQMFPTWREVLQVVHRLGYQKTGPVASSTKAEGD